MLFLFPFFGDFHTGRNTNHCRCHNNNDEYRHWRGTIFCCSFSSDHFSGILWHRSRNWQFAGPLTRPPGPILIAATSFPLSARSPPFCAFSSAESVPAALLPLFPDVQNLLSLLHDFRNLLPHWILIHLQHCHFLLGSIACPVHTDSCCQGDFLTACIAVCIIQILDCDGHRLFTRLQDFKFQSIRCS